MFFSPSYGLNRRDFLAVAGHQYSQDIPLDSKLFVALARYILELQQISAQHGFNKKAKFSSIGVAEKQMGLTKNSHARERITILKMITYSNLQ